MVTIINAPQPYVLNKFSVFLAGSIENGNAERWQDRVIGALKNEQIALINPRRWKWDDTWKQSIDNPMFKDQVEWELDGLEKADLIVMYFDPSTKSPISLLELGLFANSKKIVVCCPNGFWRKGNVDIVCKQYGIPQVNSIENLIKEIKRKQYESTTINRRI